MLAAHGKSGNDAKLQHCYNLATKITHHPLREETDARVNGKGKDETQAGCRSVTADAIAPNEMITSNELYRG
jgi:hypothetical protein